MSEKENVYEDYFVVLKDSTHTFRVSIQTFLKCLHLMEEKGAVPPIPDQWWKQIEESSLPE